jgi:hypothetical protein
VLHLPVSAISKVRVRGLARVAIYAELALELFAIQSALLGASIECEYP